MRAPCGQPTSALRPSLFWSRRRSAIRAACLWWEPMAAHWQTQASTNRHSKRSIVHTRPTIRIGAFSTCRAPSSIRWVDAEAQRHYANALKMVPDDPAVLSNLGLSYMLTKDLKNAELTLRRAAHNRARARKCGKILRWLLACAGVFRSGKIASADLPENEAAANVAYLKQMLAQQGSWKKMGRATAGPDTGPDRFCQILMVCARAARPLLQSHHFDRRRSKNDHEQYRQEE